MESSDPLALNQVLISQYEVVQGKMTEALTWVYFNIFVEFNRLWTSKPRTIMEFNQFLDRVYDGFKDRVGPLLEEYLKNHWRLNVKILIKVKCRRQA